MRYYMILILVFLTSACGDECQYNQGQQSEKCMQQSKQNSAKNQNEFEERQATFKSTSDDEVDVEVDVKVKVSVNEKEEEKELIPFLISKERMNWDDAVANTPEGYRMPTKDELALLISVYVIDEYSGDGPESPRLFWTFTPAYDTSSWAMDIKDGSEHSYNRMANLEVIYIGEDANVSAE